MGIDIYMRWAKMSEAEKEAQYTGFDTTKGSLGYLREAYHGEPYATRVLVPEAFGAENGEAEIPAATLRERLDETLRAAVERERIVYKRPAPDPSILKSYREFVELAEKKEKETRKPVTIKASY